MATKISTGTSKARAILAGAAAGALLMFATAAGAEERRVYTNSTTYEITKYAFSGQTVRAFTVVSAQADCVPNKVFHRVTKAPAGGKLEITPSEEFGHWTTGARVKCTEKRIPGIVARYTPNEGFAGEDHLEVVATDDTGWRAIYQVKVVVEK